MYEYSAEVIRVIDGDTLEVRLDLGFKIQHTTTLRLAGLNAPEMRTDEGHAAKAWLTAELSEKKIFVETIKDKKEKYGRYLAKIDAQDDGGMWYSVNDRMIAEGQAVRM